LKTRIRTPALADATWSGWKGARISALEATYPPLEMNSMSEARSLQFVDTNILVYAHDISAGQKHDRAQELLRGLWQSEEGCLSIQVLQEFYVTITQKVTKPLPLEDAAQIIADLSAWQVHSPRAEDVLDAILLQKRHQVSFWDAMILASAHQMGCTVLWSEDLNPGQVYDQVQVRSPF
jgi:predicted nucleic acid-binding protein